MNTALQQLGEAEAINGKSNWAAGALTKAKETCGPCHDSRKRCTGWKPLEGTACRRCDSRGESEACRPWKEKIIFRSVDPSSKGKSKDAVKAEDGKHVTDSAPEMVRRDPVSAGTDVRQIGHSGASTEKPPSHVLAESSSLPTYDLSRAAPGAAGGREEILERQEGEFHHTTQNGMQIPQEIPATGQGQIYQEGNAIVSDGGDASTTISVDSGCFSWNETFATLQELFAHNRHGCYDQRIASILIALLPGLEVPEKRDYFQQMMNTSSGELPSGGSAGPQITPNIGPSPPTPIMPTSTQAREDIIMRQFLEDEAWLS